MARFQSWNMKSDLTEALQTVVSSPPDGDFYGFTRSLSLGSCRLRRHMYLCCIEHVYTQINMLVALSCKKDWKTLRFDFTV